VTVIARGDEPVTSNIDRDRAVHVERQPIRGLLAVESGWFFSSNVGPPRKVLGSITLIVVEKARSDNAHL
jgi:hypothetical protein